MSGMYKKMWEMCSPKMDICRSMFMPHTIMHKGLKIATLMALREQPLTGYAVTKYIRGQVRIFSTCRRCISHAPDA